MVKERGLTRPKRLRGPSVKRRLRRLAAATAWYFLGSVTFVGGGSASFLGKYDDAPFDGTKIWRA